jgi:uncharacterized protein YecE (DUF72 family)
MSILIGTSGYSYEDWKGYYYPKDIQKSDMLSFYSKNFKTTEINFTYYRMPNPYIINRIASKVPDNFIFSVKANSLITHEREATYEDFGVFIKGISPLIEREQLACILAQFPWSFKLSRKNLDYIKYLRDNLIDLPLVIEFRNISWIKDEIFNFLKQNNIGFCCVDQPKLKGLIPQIAEVTSETAYVRFHGRNTQKWWHHKKAYERYDYEYKQDELLEWIPKIKEMDKKAKKTLVYFNNHYKSKAVKSANLLLSLL